MYWKRSEAFENPDDIVPPPGFTRPVRQMPLVPMKYDPSTLPFTLAQPTRPTQLPGSQSGLVVHQFSTSSTPEPQGRKLTPSQESLFLHELDASLSTRIQPGQPASHQVAATVTAACNNTVDTPHTPNTPAQQPAQQQPSSLPAPASEPSELTVVDTVDTVPATLPEAPARGLRLRTLTHVSRLPAQTLDRVTPHPASTLAPAQHVESSPVRAHSTSNPLTSFSTSQHTPVRLRLRQGWILVQRRPSQRSHCLHQHRG